MFQVSGSMAADCHLYRVEQPDDVLAGEFGFSPLDSPSQLRSFVAKKFWAHAKAQTGTNQGFTSIYAIFCASLLLNNSVFF